MTADKKHKLNNGSQYEVAGIEDDGKIRLTNGWFLAPNFHHFSHGYVTTSHASQGKTVDRVLTAMGQESVPAIGAEQFYVSVSRGRDKATIFTDVAPDALRDAVQKADNRKSATELVQPLPKRRRAYSMLSKARSAWNNLRGRQTDATPDMTKQREYGHVR